MPINLPNTLTWLRILLIPVFLMFYYLPDTWMERQSVNMAAAGIFLLAAVTDWLDGYLARKLEQTSAFGAFLDPVADKLMVAAALILLLQLGRVDAIVALVIIGREIAISALREWMAGEGQRKNVAVAFIGKFKTASQMIAILLLLYHDTLFGLDIQDIGTWLIYIAAVLTVVSMVYYIGQAFFSSRKPSN
jgi:cardiolipin synthase